MQVWAKVNNMQVGQRLSDTEPGVYIGLLLKHYCKMEPCEFPPNEEAYITF